MRQLDTRLGPMKCRPATISASETLNNFRLSSSLLYNAAAANDACEKSKTRMLGSWERMLIICKEAMIVLVQLGFDEDEGNSPERRY